MNKTNYRSRRLSVLKNIFITAITFSSMIGTGLLVKNCWNEINKSKIEKILEENVCGQRFITNKGTEYLRLENGTLYEKVNEKNYDF